MYFIWHVWERSVEISTNNDLIAKSQAFKTMLQVLPHMLPFREDLACAMLQGPNLLVNNHKIMWMMKVQSYLKHTSMNMVCNRNLILSDQCSAHHEQEGAKAGG